MEMTTAMQPINGSTPVNKLSMWHTMIVDWRLTNPGNSWSECAELFKVTGPWLSTVINSDIFKKYFATRLKDHQDMVSAELIASASVTAKTGLEVLQRKLSTEEKSLELNDVTKAVEITMKTLGYGHSHTAASANTPVTVQIGMLSPEELEKARNSMRAISAINSEEIEDAEVAAESLLPQGDDVKTFPEPPVEGYVPGLTAGEAPSAAPAGDIGLEKLLKELEEDNEGDAGDSDFRQEATNTN